MSDNSSLRIGQQFKYYPLLAVLYAILMVTAQAVAYRLIKIGPILEPGGIFVFPLTFAISDVIAEVYGPTLARRAIFFALFAQAFYSIIPLVVNSLPYPDQWHHADAFKVVFQSSWLVFLSNLSAVCIGMILNTQLIGKTKLIMRGKYFTLRSLFSSAIGELILTAIIVSIALVPIEGVEIGARLFINMFLFKVAFSIVVVYPASLLVVIFRRLDRVDIYEKDVSLNPLRMLKIRSGNRASNVIDMVSVKGKIVGGS